MSPAHPTEPGTQLSGGGLLFGIPGTHSTLLLLLIYCSSLPVIAALFVCQFRQQQTRLKLSVLKLYIEILLFFGEKRLEMNYWRQDLTCSPSSLKDCERFFFSPKKSHFLCSWGLLCVSGTFSPNFCRPFGVKELVTQEMMGVGKKALVVLSCQCDCQPGGLALRWQVCVIVGEGTVSLLACVCRSAGAGVWV